MKRNIAVVLTVLLVSGLAFAQAQYQKQQEQMPLLGKPTQQQHMKSQQDLKQLKENLKAANIEEGTILQTMYVVGAEVEAFSPAHIIAVKEDLNLTADQEQKLKQLMQQTQQQAKQILNEQQQATVQQMQPMTVFYAMQQLEPVLQQQGQAFGRPAQPHRQMPGQPSAGQKHQQHGQE